MALRKNGIIEKSEYVGKTLEEAQKYAKQGGFTTRIVEENGKSFMVTHDHRSDRLNFRISNNKVIDVFGG